MTGWLPPIVLPRPSRPRPSRRTPTWGTWWVFRGCGGPSSGTVGRVSRRLELGVPVVLASILLAGAGAAAAPELAQRWEHRRDAGAYHAYVTAYVGGWWSSSDPDGSERDEAWVADHRGEVMAVGRPRVRVARRPAVGVGRRRIGGAHGRRPDQALPRDGRRGGARPVADGQPDAGRGCVVPPVLVDPGGPDGSDRLRGRLTRRRETRARLWRRVPRQWQHGPVTDSRVSKATAGRGGVDGVAGGAAARHVRRRGRPGGASATGCCTASGSASGGVTTSG